VNSEAKIAHRVGSVTLAVNVNPLNLTKTALD
jgi:hypothetical protein